MSTHGDFFTDVVNDMMKELHTLPRGTDIILSLITNNNNLDSPVLPEIQQLSLSKLSANQMTTLLPVLVRMTGLLSLALPKCKASADHFKFLFTECPALSKLQSLDLHDAKDLKSQDLMLLSQSTILTNLTSLNLYGCPVVISRAPASPQRGGFTVFGSFYAGGGSRTPDASGLIALLWSPVVKNLTQLDLGFTTIQDPLVYIAVATSPFLSNLVSLGLSLCWLKQDAVAALAASTTLTNIIHLNLSYNRTYGFLDDTVVIQLFSPPSLLAKKLQSLKIGGSYITVSSLKVLLEASPQLRELDLEDSHKLGPDGLAFIATHMSNLTKLNLSYCNIGAAGFAALAASTALFNLRELNLKGHCAPAASIVELVNSPAMANLTDLNLTSTHLGPEVLTAIAQAPSMSKLQCLVFSGNDAGDDGITALAQSTTLTNLTSLNLDDNEMGTDGLNALCTSPVVSKLTTLSLNYNYDGQFCHNGTCGTIINPVLHPSPGAGGNRTERRLSEPTAGVPEPQSVEHLRDWVYFKYHRN